MLIFKRFLLGLWFIWTCWFTYVTNQELTTNHNFFLDVIMAFLLFNAVPLYILHHRRKRRNIRLAFLARGDINRSIQKHAKFWRRLEKITLLLASAVGIYSIAWTLHQIPSLKEVPLNRKTVEVVRGPVSRLISWEEVYRQSSTPVTWRTCHEISVFVNPDKSTVAVPEIISLLSDVNEMTGLDFQYKGFSKEIPPIEDGKDKNTLLIAFYTEEESKKGFEFGNSLGRAFAVKDGEISRGYIGIKVPEFNEASDQAQKQVLAHEFGHILGLGHTTKPTDLMAPIAIGQEVTYNAVVRKYFKEHPGCVRKK